MPDSPTPDPARPVRIGVIGVGHLGKHHARLLHGEAAAQLVAVADTVEAARNAAAEAYGCPAFADYKDLVGKVDAVSVVVPTALHREVAGFFLENGIDVLVEKPLTRNSVDGKALVDLADQHDRILQVGHVERFNVALTAIRGSGLKPRYIESNRLSPFSFRSTDIGVVLDLMIHDIDLVLSLVGSEVVSVEAFGGNVFTPAEDMASAILKFANGAVAHLTASRVALKPMRRMRVFAHDGYVSLDFQSSKGTAIRKNPGWEFGDLDLSKVDRGEIGDLWKFVFEGLLSVEEYSLDSGNPLQEELRGFLVSVQDRSVPQVPGSEGLAAVRVAEQILERIADHKW